MSVSVSCQLIQRYNIFRSIKREDLVKYIQEHYKGNRMVLAGAGGMFHLVLNFKTQYKEVFFVNSAPKLCF